LQARHRASPVILRAVAGSTRADHVASGVDSATARGMTGRETVPVVPHDKERLRADT
jgi:hypothetical protein